MPALAPPTQPFVLVPDDAPAGALAGAVLAIGNFDGVHRGHQHVIAAALARAESLGTPAAALTFEPHPRAFFRPGEPLFRLTEPAAKLRLLAATGVDGAFVATFDAALASLSAQDFVDRVLVKRCRIAGVAVGTNFHFGKGRAGSPDFLAAQAARHGFTLDIVEPLRDDGRVVSSGAVRDALATGQVGGAAALLGFPWFVTGTVVGGDRRGRDLGFPTANIQLDPACRLRHGIYAVRVGLGGRRLDGVASFGRRPTFDDGAPLLEVFLFDFSGDLYGRTLDVAFIDWVRAELRFDSVDALVRRMHEDAAQARAVLARSPAFPPVAPLP